MIHTEKGKEVERGEIERKKGGNQCEWSFASFPGIVQTAGARGRLPPDMPQWHMALNYSYLKTNVFAVQTIIYTMDKQPGPTV